MFKSRENYRKRTGRKEGRGNSSEKEMFPHLELC
jgi:hypothetical protein